MAEVIGLAASIVSLIQITAQITQLSYSYLHDIKSAPKTQKQYLQEIAAFTDVLFRVEQAIHDGETIGISQGRPASLSQDVINECRGHLTAIHSELEKKVQKLTWPFKEKELRKQMDALHRYRAIFSDFVSANILASTNATYREVNSLKRAYDKQQLLMRLQEGLGTSREPPLACPGTGSWLIESDEYRAWRDGCAGVLWYYGAPGVGKTLLASIVISDLNTTSASALVTHYFCDFATRQQQTPVAVFQSILRQVIHNGNADILSVVGEDSEASESLQNTNTLVRILARVSSLETNGYLVLDAPDELERPASVLLHLRTLVDSGWRILVTSRDIPSIRKSLPKAMEYEIKASSKDVETYVSTRFQELDLISQIHDCTALVDEIVMKADGLFLSAKLIVDQLLELPSARKMRKALKSAPSKLDEAFAETLRRIKSQPQKDLALRVMQWITHAFRPLRVEEIMHALAVEDDEEEVFADNVPLVDFVLRICAGLVIVDQATHTLRMAHTSIYEFIRSISATEAIHKDVASTSLRYLCCKPMALGPCSTLDGYLVRLKTTPFLSYAAQQLGRHIFVGSAEDQLLGLILRLLNDEKTRWSAFQALQFPSAVKNQDLTRHIFHHIPTGQQELHLAAFWNFKTTATALLDEGEILTVFDSQSWTPLHWASVTNNIATVEVLLKHVRSPQDIDPLDSEGWSPLFWASYKGHLDIVRALLSHRANHLIRSKTGWTALHWAVAAQEKKVVVELLEHHRKSKAEWTPLPIKSFNVTQAQEYVASMAITPANLLPETENFDLIDTFTQKLDDLNLFELGGHLLEEREAAEILAKPFDPSVSNIWRTRWKASKLSPIDTEGSENAPQLPIGTETHLIMKMGRWQNVPSYEYMLELGPRVDYYGMDYFDGVPPIFLAAQSRNPKFVQVLLDRGADPNIRDEGGWTPLHHAVWSGEQEIALVLLKAGADANAMPWADGILSDRSRNVFKPASPIQLACLGNERVQSNYHASMDMVRLLLDHGADLYISMLPAIRRGYAEVVEELLQRGACRDLDYAAESKVMGALVEMEWREPDMPREHARIFDLFVKNIEHDALVSMIEATVSKRQGWIPDDCVTEVWLYRRWPLLRRFLQFSPDIELGISFADDGLMSKDIQHTFEVLAPDSLDYELLQLLTSRGFRITWSSAAVRSTVISLAWLIPRVSEHAKLLERSCLTIQALVDAGADVNSDAITQWWKLRFESGSKYLERCFTCDEGFRSGVSEPITGPTAIWMASKLIDSDEVISTLLGVGGDPYIEYDNQDAFLMALIHNNLSSLMVLLEHSKKHPMPSHWTEHYFRSIPDESPLDFTALCMALKEAGFLNPQRRKGEILLHSAAFARNRELVKSLLDLESDAPSSILDLSSRQNSKQRNAIQEAIYQDNMLMVQFLRETCAETLQTDGSYTDVLLYAIAKKDLALVSKLLPPCADIDIMNSEGWRPLHAACYHGTIEIVGNLLAAGADLHARIRGIDISKPNFQEWTLSSGYNYRACDAQPLHLAVFARHKNVVKALLASGADVNATFTMGSREEMYNSKISPLRFALSLRRRWRNWDTKPDGHDLGTHSIPQDTGDPWSRYRWWEHLDLDEEGLEIAKILVDQGADVRGVADDFSLEDVCKFGGFEDLWDRMRKGITDQGETVQGPLRTDRRFEPLMSKDALAIGC